MADLALVPTQSALTEPGDDMAPVGHVSTSIKLVSEGNVSPRGSPQKIHSVEISTDGPMMNQPVSWSRKQVDL